MSDAIPSAPDDGMAPSFVPVDISGTLAEGRWALLSGDDVVGVETRDPAGRFPDALDIVDARDTPDVAAGWRRVGGRLVAPEAPAATRVIPGTTFLDLFTDAEMDALWGAGGKFRRGAMRVMSQDSANLASPELADLLGTAVKAGLLTEARAERVAAGLPPDAGPTPAAPPETPPASADEPA